MSDNGQQDGTLGPRADGGDATVQGAASGTTKAPTSGARPRRPSSGELDRRLSSAVQQMDAAIERLTQAIAQLKAEAAGTPVAELTAPTQFAKAAAAANRAYDRAFAIADQRRQERLAAQLRMAQDILDYTLPGLDADRLARARELISAGAGPDAVLAVLAGIGAQSSSLPPAEAEPRVETGGAGAGAVPPGTNDGADASDGDQP